jgi:hypothetical protein
MTVAWMCAGKRRFATREAAMRMVRDVQRHGRSGNGRLTAYQCPICRHYHAGHVA